MPLNIQLISEADLEAARAFNARMRAANAPTDLLLPENVPPRNERDDAARRSRHYVIRDGEFVRGGFLRVDQPGWLNAAECHTVNYQSPLSEGIADRRFIMVAPLMLRFMEKHGDGQFMLGMGGEDKPLAKFLRSAGWLVRPAPFLFRVHRAGRFLRELPVRHRSRTRSFAAQAARWSGLGPLGATLAQWRALGAAEKRNGFTIERVTEWGEWADEIWARFREDCSFAVCRDRRSLREMYDLEGDPRLIVMLVRLRGQSVGWTASYITAMKDNAYFGNMQVATILDSVALRHAMRAAAALTDRELGAQAADLTITNQTHASWVRAFRESGFLAGPSKLHRGCV